MGSMATTSSRKHESTNAEAVAFQLAAMAGRGGKLRSIMNGSVNIMETAP